MKLGKYNKQQNMDLSTQNVYTSKKGRLNLGLNLNLKIFEFL